MTRTKRKDTSEGTDRAEYRWEYSEEEIRNLGCSLFHQCCWVLCVETKTSSLTAVCAALSWIWLFNLTSLEAPKEYRQTAAPILFYNKPKQNVTKTFCSTTVLTKCLKMTSLPTKQLHVALIVWNEIPELGHAHMCFHGYHMHCVNAYCRSLIRIDGNCCRETHVLMAGLGIYQKIL